MFDKSLSFKGRHADYLRKLCPSRLPGEKILQRPTIYASNIEVILAAPIVGFQYNRRSPEAHDSPDIPKNNIFLEQLNNIREPLELNYRIIMLLHDKKNIPFEDRINRAFRYDRDDEKRAVGDQIFFEYMRGGIEVLYEKLVEKSTSTDEDVEKLYEFLEEYTNLFCKEVSMENIIAMCNQSGV